MGCGIFEKSRVGLGVSLWRSSQPFPLREEKEPSVLKLGPERVWAARDPRGGMEYALPSPFPLTTLLQALTRTQQLD